MFAIELTLADKACMSFGLCTQKDPLLWDGVPVSRSKYARRDFTAARKICGECPVSNICLERAIENEDTGCMRGGKTPEELEELVQQKHPVKRQRVQVVKANRAKAAA
jgi:hypothetical protein